MNAKARAQAVSQAVEDSGPEAARRYVSRAFEMQLFGKIAQATLDLHLDLYKGYVVQANSVLDSVAVLDRMGGEMLEDPARPAESLARRLSFELGGVTLHELFFEQFVPCDAGPTGAFEQLARANFGSIEQWMAAVQVLAKTRGIGWVATLFDAQRGYLHNLWIASHDLQVPAGYRPVFVLDLWEHAWLADYGLKGRDQYVADVLHVVSRNCLDARVGHG